MSINIFYRSALRMFKCEKSLDEAISAINGVMVPPRFGLGRREGVVGKVNKHRVHLGYMYPNRLNSWRSIFKGKFSEKEGHLTLSGYYKKSVFSNAVKIYSIFFVTLCFLIFASEIYQDIRQYILYQSNADNVRTDFLMLFVFMFVCGGWFFLVKMGMSMGKEDETRIDRVLEKALGCKAEIENQQP